MRLLVDVHQLKNGYDGSCARCASCSDIVNCSLAHVLFECSGLIKKRIMETEILRNECRINMLTDFPGLNNQDSTIYISVPVIFLSTSRYGSRRIHCELVKKGIGLALPLHKLLHC